MTDKVIIAEELNEDIQKTYEYLYKDSPDTAEAFLQDVIAKRKSVEKNPQAYRLVRTKRMANKRRQYRYIKVLKSWKLLYKLPTITQGLLIFLGLIHDKQSEAEIERRRTRRYDEG